MAIAGLGTDIVEIARFDTDKAVRDRLARRVLTPGEWQLYCEHNQPERYLAKRFAAKEAAVKALGTGIGRGISWQHIHVSHTEAGAPVLNFSGEFAEQCKVRGIVSAHVSLSDEQHYAVATVILETL
ncbi:holo-ACP synthase [Alteromonas lipolytica]|uniref:Holo-[acyl-carrier-protein] synthase n=1 Tax=Alteromonas lipolytica TaxID=1856405 RepID=A0A1E8FDV3_9ALTE|nr:holo-ACP synthase [Alteromonas lipolytica]OFI33768.1 holo-ACP synthase [Alteromonas lipolytica]GGF68558.1 holo-[acyl-carrier-protein] synthase [Alteromonas lipolytica]